MEAALPRTMRRANARGQTVENGGVWIFRSPGADLLGERQRNSLRPFGFEELAIAKGEKMLLIQKACVAGKGSESEEDDETDEEEDESLRFADGSYATGNMPCEVVDFKVGRYVKVKVLSKLGSKSELIVPVKTVEKNGVALPLIGLKPWCERVVDLAQGFETRAPVHVVATKIFGRGKFYVAVTRCRDLKMLKISGVNDYNDLRRLVKSNWRGIYFYIQHNEWMPATSVRYAKKEKEKFDNLTADA